MRTIFIPRAAACPRDRECGLSKGLRLPAVAWTRQLTSLRPGKCHSGQANSRAQGGEGSAALNPPSPQRVPPFEAGESAEVGVGGVKDQPALHGELSQMGGHAEVSGGSQLPQVGAGGGLTHGGSDHAWPPNCR